MMSSPSTAVMCGQGYGTPVNCPWWVMDCCEYFTERAQRGAVVAAVGRRGAVATTADGATLRALASRAPGAAAQLAAAGTRELCALD